jgi:hypothetical protein
LYLWPEGNDVQEI